MSLEEDREALRKEAERQALAQLEKAKVREASGAVLALFPPPPHLRDSLDGPRVKSRLSHFLAGVPLGLDVRLSVICKMWALIAASLCSIISA